MPVIMLHPTRENPQRYRLLDKELKVQEYYSFAVHGKRKALKLAKARKAELDKKKDFRQMQKNLSINKIFRPDGSVKGLARRTRERTGRTNYDCLSVNVTVAPKLQKSIEVSLVNRTYDEAYLLVQEKILSAFNIERTHEITMMFKAVKRQYDGSEVSPLSFSGVGWP